MWNRPDQELEPDDTVEFDPVTDPDDDGQVLGADPDDPPGWLLHAEHAPTDGWVCIEIVPLSGDEQGERSGP